jgi:hypothetical protein
LADNPYKEMRIENQAKIKEVGSPQMAMKRLTINCAFWAACVFAQPIMNNYAA